MYPRIITRISLALLAPVLASCWSADPLASQRMADLAAAPATVSIDDQFASPPPARGSAGIQVAVDDPRRLSADRPRDIQRRAGTVLAFFGIRPGMTVLDMFSGGGYYAEILSYLVGVEGQVIAHNNSPFMETAADELLARYAPGRLGNVERLLAENNELQLPPAAFDAVLLILAYHDIYYVDKQRGWPRIDGPKMLAEIYQSLKPGSVMGVVDHAAWPGAPAAVGGTLHRIDPALLRRDFEAAGFVLEAESNILRNFADSRTESVFTPWLRGRTDRVVLRFRKPAF